MKLGYYLFHILLTGILSVIIFWLLKTGEPALVYYLIPFITGMIFRILFFFIELKSNSPSSSEEETELEGGKS